MHPKPLSFLVPFALSLAPLCAQQIAYQKFQLPNGMTVILHEDHRLPMVTINTWFRVGSKDEPAGRTGFAHLFEHLMFMGTERVPGNDFDVVMESGGGNNNASTTEDRTNYFSEGPAALLPTLLWLDADRLEDLGRTMTKEKLDRQREVVRNEIRQNVENTPYGRSREMMCGLMFPAGHPYHHPVYGSHEDLEAATVDDVKDFFATFYVPNNASLVVAGDFDPAVVKPLVEQLFGTLARGAEVTRQPVPEAKLDRVVRTTVLDQVPMPLVKMCWHSPRAWADGDAEMSLLGGVLTSGKSSRLYKRLVMDEQIAVDVSAYQDSLVLGSMFSIDVTAPAGADLDRIERAVDEELAKVVKDGVTADELGRRVASRELGTLSRLQSLGSVADALNSYEFALGEPDAFARDLDRYRKVTPAGVMQWARTVLDPQRRAVVRVLPVQPERGATPRDKQPGPAAAGTFAPQLPESVALDNGIPVHVFTRPDLPLVSIQLQFADGAPLLQPATAGLGGLTTTMMTQGAGTRDALAFSEAVQALGASCHVGADHENAIASLTVLKRNLEAATDLLADAVRRPRFAEADFSREQRLLLEELKQEDEEPQVVAGRVAARALFGAADPYGWPQGGTVATVSKLTLEKVKQEHARVFAPRNCRILVAGDITAAAARTLLQARFGDWPTPAPQVRGDVVVPGPRGVVRGDVVATNGLRVLLVDRPSAVQTVVRLIAPGPRFADPSRMRCQLLNTLLGGSFTSRLNQNLRERHGYTYGAHSGFSMSPFSGSFGASAAVQAEVTGPAIREFLTELKRLAADQGDLTAEELEKGRRSLRAGIVQSFGSLYGVLGNAAELLLNGAPFTTTASDLQTLDAITLAELNGAGKQALQLDRAILVLVGDEATVKKQLEGLGLPTPVLVDSYGEPRAR